MINGRTNSNRHTEIIENEYLLISDKSTVDNSKECNEMERKGKLQVIAIGVLLTLVLGFVIIDMANRNAAQAYEKGLTEGMGLNRLAPFESTVYWYKNGQFVYAEHNVITYVGLNATRWYLSDQGTVNNNASTNAFRWIGIGSGSGGGASSTTLQTEEFRAAATFALVGGVNGNWTLTYTWTAGTFSGETITEAGVFNAAASGILLNYQDFSGITLQSTDSLQVQFMFQVS